MSKKYTDEEVLAELIALADGSLLKLESEDPITLKSSLANIYLGDSLDQLEWVMAIEDHFGFARGISDDALKKRGTVQEIVDLIQATLRDDET
jgi:acyl carrier protein